MRIHWQFVPALTGMALVAPVGGAIIYPVNNGFEVPNDGAGGYSYANQSAGTANPKFAATFPSAQLGWFFGGNGTGVAANASAFGVNGADNGNNDGAGGTVGTTSGGGQAGFIQGGNGTTTGTAPTYLQQTLSGFSAGPATVTFKAEGRPTSGTVGANNIQVMLDNTTLTFGASGSTLLPASGSFATFTSDPLTLAAGSHTLTFIGLGTGAAGTTDVTTFVDSVSVSSTTPEPASLGLVAAGALGLLSRRRRGV